MPRKPSTSTRLGLLRSIIGCDQKHLAAEAGISLSLISSIEVGRRKMTEDVAATIMCTTGVSYRWLLGKGRKAKPTSHNGAPFTRSVYNELRHLISMEEKKDPLAHSRWLLEYFKMQAEEAMSLAADRKEVPQVESLLNACLSWAQDFVAKRQTIPPGAKYFPKFPGSHLGPALSQTMSPPLPS